MFKVEAFQGHVQEAIDIITLGVELEYTMEFQQNSVYQVVFAAQNALRQELRVENGQRSIQPAHHLEEIDSRRSANWYA